MRRREFIAALSGATVAWPVVARAQQPAAPPRIGVLTPQHSTESSSVQREPFERGLRELGWTPGADVLIDYRYGQGSNERVARLAVELVRANVDLILARGSVATRAAQNATRTIPIVMSVVADPVREGFIASLARPGGNITGLAFLPDGPLEAKRLELLKEAIPGLQHVAVLTNPANSGGPGFTEGLDAAARALNLTLHMFKVRSATALPEIFEAIRRTPAGALLLGSDPEILEPNNREVLALALKHKLPPMHPWRFTVEAGGLISYSASLYDLHRRSAAYVHKILKGSAQPEELPVELPVKFQLVINLRTAKSFGIEFPPALLARADEVIE